MSKSLERPDVGKGAFVCEHLLLQCCRFVWGSQCIGLKECQGIVSYCILSAVRQQAMTALSNERHKLSRKNIMMQAHNQRFKVFPAHVCQHEEHATIEENVGHLATVTDSQGSTSKPQFCFLLVRSLSGSSRLKAWQN